MNTPEKTASPRAVLVYLAACFVGSVILSVTLALTARPSAEMPRDAHPFWYAVRSSLR